jgi:putative toxin-antitoxin system antitoxin component (TIGR02293 family)
MDSARATAGVMGGSERLGSVPSQAMDFVEVIRAGVPYAAFEALADTLGWSIEETRRALRFPARTLHRRRQGRRLDEQQSERVVRLAHVVACAIDVVGTADKASRWLRTPIVALGGRAPIDLIDTDVGAGEVLNVLGRLDHGVFG